MKLDLSKQESRLPLVEIPEDNKKRIKELDGEFLNLYKIIGHNPTMLTGWIEDLMMWRESPRYNDAERAALAFTEAMMAGDTTDEVFDELKKHFPPSEIIELALTAGFYAMVPRFLNALRISIEQETLDPPFPSPNPA
jgi:hypothetical protein